VRRSLARALGLLSLSFSFGVLAAAPVIAEGFENGFPAAWRIWGTVPDVISLGLSPEAAHRGAQGLRLVDNDGTSGRSTQGYVNIDLNQSTGDYFVRFWLRFDPKDPTGAATLSGLLTDNSNVIIQTGYRHPDGVMTLGGSGVRGDFIANSSAGVVVDGDWHLVEYAMEGMGTPNGARRIWLDGKEQATHQFVDWSDAGFAPRILNLGQVNSSDPAYVGFVDFDDLRAGPVRWANRFAFTFPAKIAQGTCVPASVRVAATNPASNVAATLEPLTVELGLGADDGLLFRDAACTEGLSTVTITAGTKQAGFHVRALGEGALALTAHHVDFLPSPGTMTVEAPQARILASATQVEPGTTVTLDGRGSTPSTGYALTSHRWRLVAAPTGVALETTAVVQALLPTAGLYRFELRVSDSAGGLSRPAIADIEVSGDIAHPRGPLRSHCSSAPGAVWGLAWAVWVWRRRGGRR
jgi:hypothetical protein